MASRVCVLGSSSMQALRSFASSPHLRSFALSPHSDICRRLRSDFSTSSSEGPTAHFPSWGALKARLEKVDCSALCDGSGKQARVLDTVRALRPGYKLVGRAHTVQLVPGDFLTNLVALEAAEADDVLMIDAGWRTGRPQWPITGGMFGELLAAEAERAGVAGLVIDGNCRDVSMLRTMNIPIFSRGSHPNAGTACKLGYTGVSVWMGGVEVRHGDIVVGDDDGVVVASEEELALWLPKAEAIVQTESKLFQQIREGRPLVELTSYYEHVKALREGEDSTLSFRPDNMK